MDIKNLLKGLNNKQREAVVAPSCSNILVLAGAGSGKTRVLIHRIAWLLSVENYSPCSVMAVTFTNKAAAEIRHRVEHFFNRPSCRQKSDMWIGTFHSLAHRLLRAHYMEADLPQNFQIIDHEDQHRLLKRLIRSLNLDDKQWSPRQARWYIENKKDEGLYPQYVKIDDNLVLEEATWLRIYEAYQNVCNRAGLVDFSELLLRTYKLWINHPYILCHYRERFTHILIDEFQDTNQIQYDWIRLLAGNEGNVMMVGDDDQAIYGWRGAKLGNIQRFLDDFPVLHRISLEQNYRSTHKILKAANALISHNGSRLDNKNLWTEGIEGEPISLYCAWNEIDEARFVINRIRVWRDQGGKLNDCAILYRSNAQSRVLEEALLNMNLPYRIYGGIRFFERKEIKEVLSYLRLIVNRNDDVAYERVINIPPRGIGGRTLEIVRQISRCQKITLWQASRLLLQDKVLVGRVASSLQRFLDLVEDLSNETKGWSLPIQTDWVINRSGLRRMYEQEKGEKGQTHIENLAELVTATRQYENDEDSVLLPPLNAFLSHIGLESGEKKGSYFQEEDAVQMMTMHSSKGLEFPSVFMVGMEEGLFPCPMSLMKRGGIEEERRLAYVGITRAMIKLTITYSETRHLYGKSSLLRGPSRFVKELPRECIEEWPLTIKNLPNSIVHPSGVHQYMSTTTTRSKNNNNLFLGQRVRHPKFGEGRVVKFEGSGARRRIQISFQRKGMKWMITSYARLEVIV